VSRASDTEPELPPVRSCAVAGGEVDSGDDLPRERTGPVPRLALGSDDHERVKLDRAYYDDPPPGRMHDFENRLAALERARATKSRRRTWVERGLSFLAGSALAVLAWAKTAAEERGSDRRAAETHTAEHRWLLDTVRRLELTDAERRGQLNQIEDRLRYPLHGPPTSPRSP
jgi:hypothetical protein